LSHVPTFENFEASQEGIVVKFSRLEQQLDRDIARCV
jgi:hypothetical protein